MSSHQDRHSGGFPGLTIVVILLVVIVIVVVIAIPGFMSASRGAPERGAWSSLRTLCTAQADFRVNDRDWNHVNDFWTGDVKGLYTMTSAAVSGALGGTSDPSIRLIELSIAGADADGTLVPAGGENLAISTYAVPSPKAGYWFAAMTGEASGRIYAQDTGGAPRMGPCHNLSAFGFVSFPDSLSASNQVYIVNEKNQVYQQSFKGRMGTANPMSRWLRKFPQEYLWWPAAAELDSSWKAMSR